MLCYECGAAGYSKNNETLERRCRKCGYEWPGPESRMPDVVTTPTEISVPSLVPTAIERQPCFVRYWNKWPDANIETPTTVSAGILVFIIPFIGLALILVWLLVGFSLA